MFNEIPLKEMQFIQGYTNCILKEYYCSCDKYWKNKNKIIIYFLDELHFDKCFEAETDNVFKYLPCIINIVNNKINTKDNLLIAGGHTVINLKDRNFASDEMINSVQLGMQILNKLHPKYNKIDFMIPLNDFFMEKDLYHEENQINCYRKEALNPYILPKAVYKIFRDYKEILDFKLFYCSEKNMADKFKRHIKNKKKTQPELFKNYGKMGENWAYILPDKEIPVILNNKPNCAAGNAATFRDINFEVNNKKIKMNYNTHIGLYPLCSMNNVIDGYLIARNFYNLKMPTILIFFDKKCF